MMEHKWAAMINLPKTGTNINSIMKMSAQLIGPKDEQNNMKMNLSDIKDPNVKLLLPPELNPVVYQWTVRIYRGMNMKIDAEWFSKIDP